MKILKSIWKWFDGKKTSFGAIGGVLLTWGMARGYINNVDADLFASLLTMWTAFAIGHKAVKNSNPKKDV